MNAFKAEPHTNHRWGLSARRWRLPSIALLCLASAAAHAFDPVSSPLPLERIDIASWFSDRPTGLGLAVGKFGLRDRSSQGLYPASLPYLDLGVQFRYTMDGNYRFQIAAWRQMAPDESLSLLQPREAVYGARVEMRLFEGHRSGFVADFGFIGLQFEGGTRLMLRRSNGKPTLYLRTSF